MLRLCCVAVRCVALRCDVLFRLGVVLEVFSFVFVHVYVLLMYVIRSVCFL